MAQRAGEAMVGRFGDLEKVRLVAEVGHICPGDGAGTAPTEEEGAPHDCRQASRHAQAFALLIRHAAPDLGCSFSVVRTV